jgi:hypothetical protein
MKAVGAFEGRPRELRHSMRGDILQEQERSNSANVIGGLAQRRSAASAAGVETIHHSKKETPPGVGVLAGQFGGLKVLRGIDLHGVSSFPESETDSCDGHHIFTFFHRL